MNAREKIAELRETLARWCRQGKSDNGETVIDESAKRALREFDRELIDLEQTLDLPTTIDAGIGRTARLSKIGYSESVDIALGRERPS